LLADDLHEATDDDPFLGEEIAEAELVQGSILIMSKSFIKVFFFV